MRVNADYSIERIDQYNLGIVKHSIRGADSKNEGEEYDNTIYYCSTLESACEKILKLCVNVEDMDTVLKSIKKTKEELLVVIKELK